jgi:hypothetical protein
LDREGQSAAAFELQLGRRISGADGRPLTSLSIDELPWTHKADDRRLGWPSELGALTRLAAPARALQPRPRPRPASWLRTPCERRPDQAEGAASPLRHLEVGRCARHDVAPMLRGLPALATPCWRQPVSARAGLDVLLASATSARALEPVLTPCWRRPQARERSSRS